MTIDHEALAKHDAKIAAAAEEAAWKEFVEVMHSFAASPEPTDMTRQERAGQQVDRISELFERKATGALSRHVEAATAELRRERDALAAELKQAVAEHAGVLQALNNSEAAQHALALRCERLEWELRSIK